MRQTKMCPDCSGRKFAVMAELHDSDDRRVPATPWINGWNLGSFEVWMCLRCGYTALYARNLPQDIEKLAQASPELLRVVDAESGGGPYR